MNMQVKRANIKYSSKISNIVQTVIEKVNIYWIVQNI